ncbi:MAG TPA: DNA/RNA nuclease SfsA [Firmicutes bacterium]|nr:DNA/RNA nuclease SfsA [Bacillota bacterium]
MAVLTSVEPQACLKTGRFIRRLNRFVCLARLQDEGIVPVHVPSSGRMQELLVPEAQIVVEAFPRTANYKTRGRLSKVLYENGGSKFWVSVDSHLPNRLFSQAVRGQTLAEFASYTGLQPEVAFNGSRLDFLLKSSEGEAFVEVKSVTLVEEGTALFPDAPTSRGARHIKDLIESLRAGFAAYLVFVIQREDAVIFTPNRHTDPAFAEVVEEAAAAGVQILAYDCKVTPDKVALRRRVPVLI